MSTYNITHVKVSRFSASSSRSLLLQVQALVELQGDVMPNHDDRGPPDGPGLVDGHLYYIREEF